MGFKRQGVREAFARSKGRRFQATGLVVITSMQRRNWYSLVNYLESARLLP